MKWLKSMLGKTKLLNDATFMKKYESPFFKDTAIQREIAIKGYAVRNLLEKDEILYLKKAFDAIMIHPDSEFGESFWNSGRAMSAEVRGMARDSINEHVRPKLSDFFGSEHAELMGGVFVAKPPTTASALNPHQDSSHVDELRFISVYAWTALDDITLDNGPVHIIPGSHLFGNHQRSLNIPWQFADFTDILWQYAEPVTMKAGQVLFFDSAAIHCSPVNKSGRLRLGVNFFIKPKESPFIHYYMEEGCKSGKIEKFGVSTDFYYNEDIMQRPGSAYPHLGVETFHDLHLNKRKVRRLCELGKRWADQR